MAGKQKVFNSRQMLFKELFVGTLIYVTILGLFNDYTSVVYAKSFSTILYAAAVLQIMTYLTLALKSKIVAWLKDKEGALYKALMFFCVWLVMFLSKFVFIWAIDSIFRTSISINGFFGVLFLVVGVTVTHKAADAIFKRLGDNNQAK